MSKARKKARASARPMTVAKRLGRTTRPENVKRLKAEQQHGTNVPARVVEKMGGSTRGVRTDDGADVAKIRPKRKARTVGSEAVAAGIVGRAYGSKGDGSKRLTSEQIAGKRAEYFKSTAASRKAARAEAVPVADNSERQRIENARAEYRHAIGQARARSEAGDASGAEAWMRKAREFRRIFRNK